MMVLLTAALMLSACSEQSNQTNTETSATDNGLTFALTNLKGDTIKAEDYRGQWLVLNYWATWCAPCRDEMPELVKFQQANQGKVQVLGIAYEDSPIDKLQQFADEYKVNYPILTIDVYNPPAFAEEGGLGLPTTIVYKPNGEKHKKHMGPIDYDGLMEMMKE